MYIKRRTIKYMNETVNNIRKLIDQSEYILIGAGSGLSTSAGIEYSGKRFEDNFKEFIEKYHFTDMYSSGFYDFDTEEEWQKYKDTIEIHPKSAFQFGVKLSDGRRKNREKRKDMSEQQRLNREYQQVKNIMSKKNGTSFDKS